MHFACGGFKRQIDVSPPKKDGFVFFRGCSTAKLVSPLVMASGCLLHQVNLPRFACSSPICLSLCASPNGHGFSHAIFMAEVTMEVVSTSPDMTFDLGRQLAGRLRSGDCVALYGDLGSGKTHFVQGVCAQLQVTEAVTSPTFVLINEYAGVGADGVALPIFHFDLYRLGDVDELLALGADEFFYGQGICLIEWADIGEEAIPEQAYRVRFEHAGEFTRKILVTGRD